MTVGVAIGELWVVMWISLWPKEKNPHDLEGTAGQSIAIILEGRPNIKLDSQQSVRWIKFLAKKSEGLIAYVSRRLPPVPLWR